MQKKMNLKNRHCEEAAGRRGNLLPLAVREPFIFLGAKRSNLQLSEALRLPRPGTPGLAMTASIRHRKSFLARDVILL